MTYDELISEITTIVCSAHMLFEDETLSKKLVAYAHLQRQLYGITQDAPATPYSDEKIEERLEYWRTHITQLVVSGKYDDPDKPEHFMAGILGRDLIKQLIDDYAKEHGYTPVEE